MPPAVPRRLATLAARASLVLCVAMVALCLFSIGWGRWTALQGPHLSYIASLSQGNLCFQIATVSPDSQRPATWRWRWISGSVPGSGTAASIGSVTDGSLWSRLGLIRTLEQVPYSDGVIDRNPMVTISRPAYCRSFVLPLWLVGLLAAWLPVRRGMNGARQHARELRRQQGRCAACGYDVRATPYRCPECGAVPAEPAAR
jgi:hypothetical protein